MFITGRYKPLLTWLLMPYCMYPKNRRSIGPVTRFWNPAIGRRRIHRVSLTESLSRLYIASIVWTVHTRSIMRKSQVSSQVKKRKKQMKIDALDNIYILGLKFFCSSLPLEVLFFFRNGSKNLMIWKFIIFTILGLILFLWIFLWTFTKTAVKVLAVLLHI